MALTDLIWQKKAEIVTSVTYFAPLLGFSAIFRGN